MNPTVLYIEDNPLNMRMVRKTLANLGYDMIEAIDGLSGLDIALRQRPDLVLVDVNLPDMDGLEVMARIKANPQSASIPVIALTADTTHSDRERCLSAGCDGYIAKPIVSIELKNLLAHFLASKSGDQMPV